MDAKTYQKEAHTFADYTIPIIYTNDGLAVNAPYVYPAMGLSEEAGEATGKLAKVIRDNEGIIPDDKKELLVKELGDVMWFVAELCTLFNVSIEDVMQQNIDKLTSRRERNKIHGSGDER